MSAPFNGQPAQHQDTRLLTGTGQFTDDIVLPHQAYGVFVRSPLAHARIVGLDARVASDSPGVLLVLTAADFAAFGGLPCGGHITGVDGTPMKAPKRPILADGTARYVGEAVALVVGHTLAAAQAGAAAVVVNYEELPAIADTAAAAGFSTALHPQAPDNVGYRWAVGDAEATQAAFAQAAHVTRLHLRNDRLIGNAIEPRAANASYDAAGDRHTLYVSSQLPHAERLLRCALVLGIPEHKMRVIAPDLGGGLGSETGLYAEETALVQASKLVGRPVKWTAERSESFLTDAHGGDHVTEAALALDADGRFLGLRVVTTANLGAYLCTFARSIPTLLYGTLLAGQYTTPAIHCAVTGVFTSTAPVDAYRGAGSAEATYVVERLVETAAHELQLDPADLRRRNFIRQFPHRTPVGLTYDTGHYEATLNQVLDLADVVGFAARRVVSEARGLKRGLGYACYLDACGLTPSQLDGALSACGGLDGNVPVGTTHMSFPAGSTVCEVEVDPRTGAVKVERFSAVDERGNVLNPGLVNAVVEGQVHGGIAQGLGQALLEQGVYDPHSGQLLTGSYLDYALPRADDLPLFAVQMAKGTPHTHNPPGEKVKVKGCGEVGTMGSHAALINALCDALGVKDVPMPASPFNVWKAAQAARV